MAHHSPHKQEHIDWLVKTAKELLDSGAAKTVNEVAQTLVDEWIKLTGRQTKYLSLRQVLLKGAQKHGIDLPILTTKPHSAPQVDAQSMAHAGYAVWVPGQNGQADSFKLFDTPGEVSILINDLVRQNMGFMPKGIKIFGEIVADIQVQVTWKNRGLPVLAPSQRGSNGS